MGRWGWRGERKQPQEQLLVAALIPPDLSHIPEYWRMHPHTHTQIHTHTYIKNTCQYTSIHTVHLFEHHTEMWFYSLYFFYILKEWVTFFNPCGQNKFVIPLVTVATAPCAVRQPFSTVFMLLVVTFQFLYIDIYFFPSFLLSWNLLLFAVMLGWTIEWDYHALALGLWE